MESCRRAGLPLTHLIVSYMSNADYADQTQVPLSGTPKVCVHASRDNVLSELECMIHRQQTCTVA